MKRNQDATCSNCPYWCLTKGDSTGNLKRGECRLKEPHPIHQEGIVVCYWPPIGPDGWCAKHPDFEDNGRTAGFTQGD